MNKSTKIALLIISTVVSLAIILANFYGYTRYISMHFSDTHKLVETYNTLDPACDKTKVILCFTVSPDKYDKIQPMINSILDQTVKVSKILLVKSPDDKSKTPEYLNLICNTLTAGKNYGYGMPLIPALLREKSDDSLIIQLEPNVVYGKDFIESLVNYAKEHKNTCVVTSADQYSILIKPNCYNQNLIDMSVTDPFWVNNLDCKHGIFKYRDNHKSI